MANDLDHIALIARTLTEDEKAEEIELVTRYVGNRIKIRNNEFDSDSQERLTDDDQFVMQLKQMFLAILLGYQIPYEQPLPVTEVKPKKQEKQEKPTHKYKGKIAPCGTEAAYRRHLRYGEEVDSHCRRAGNEKNQKRKAKRRAQKLMEHPHESREGT